MPGADLSITVLTTSGAARAGDLLRKVGRAALGTPLMVRQTVVALTAADRARYAGVYALALPGGACDFTVAAQGDELTLPRDLRSSGICITAVAGMPLKP